MQLLYTTADVFARYVTPPIKIYFAFKNGDVQYGMNYYYILLFIII
jgi:hypothetical protein